jgi:hypothetical protein
LRQLLDAARDAWGDGPFPFFIFLLFGLLPVLGFAYIALRAVLGLFGIELPAPATSVR